MTTEIKIGIIIPALNEAASIREIVEAVSRHGMPIVVDDGSTDATQSIAREAMAHVVRHGRNRGYDDALESGFRRANELGCDWVITIDADGQHAPELLVRFIRELENGADVVLGIRDRKQRYAEHIFALLTTCLWGMQDPLCGMKGYRMDVFRQRGHFDSFHSIGTELALYAVRSRFKIAEVPIVTKPRVGAARFGRSTTANLKILRAMILAVWRTRPERTCAEA